MGRNKRRKGQKGDEPTPLLLASARLPAVRNHEETVKKRPSKARKEETSAATVAEEGEECDIIEEEDTSLGDAEGSVASVQENQADSANDAFSHSGPSIFAVTRATAQAREYAVLHLQDSAQLSLAGSLSLVCLHGTCVVNGAQLGKGNQVKIAAPTWSAAAVLNVLQDASVSLSNRIHPEAVTLARRLLAVSPIQEGDVCVVAISPTTNADYDYRDITSLDVDATKLPDGAVQRLRELDDKVRTETSVLLHSGYRVMAAQSARVLKLPYLSIAQSWEDVALALVEANQSTHEAKAVICGPKGAGKSTCVRYLINRLLSECPAVAVLDCDVGQPEFNPSGVVSLHIITNPVLDLPHHHIRQPLRSYLIGDVSPKNDPLLFAACVRSLSQLYHDIQPLLQFKKSVNELDCLAPHEAMQLQDTLTEMSSWQSPSPVAVPLVVNTDGWIRAMGSDILGAILDLVNPTVLGRLGESKRIPPPLFVPPGGCKTFELHSGVTVQSRALAAELRTLRLVSYFTQNMASKPTFAVRSGQLLDSEANLAKLVTTAPVLRLPFRAIKLRSFTSQLAPAMALAAFNAALVAIVHTTTAEVSTPVQLCGPDPSQPSGHTRFALDCVGELPSTATCLGFGIVRAIDVSQQCLYLHTPIEKSVLQENSGSIFLVLSELSTPQQFWYYPGAPSHAYFSSDTAGEGAATIRSRGTTMKRKSAQR